MSPWLRAADTIALTIAVTPIARPARAVASRPRRGRCQGCLTGLLDSGVDREHDASRWRAGGRVSQCLRRLRQRERPVDDDAELAGLEELGQRGHQRALVR